MGVSATLTGGEKLKKKLKELQAKLQNGQELNVGFLENAKYPDGQGVAQVAAWQEFGTGGIPPRPFFRNMIAKESPHWAHDAAELLRHNRLDAGATLRQMGKLVKGELQLSINTLTAPPLSPVTLMLRKMWYADKALRITGKTVGEAAARVAAGESTSGAPTKPLIWTGKMVQSVDYEIK